MCDATDVGRAPGLEIDSRPRPTPAGVAGIVAAQVRTKVWLELDGAFVIGDGSLRLLLGVARHGSLAEAVRELGWSYRHAWGYLRRAEALLGVPLVRTRAGKGAMRGMALTDEGHALMERLKALRTRIDEAVGPSSASPADRTAGARMVAPRQGRPRIPR